MAMSGVATGGMSRGLEAGVGLGLARLIRRLVAEDGYEGIEAAARAIEEYERFFRLAARGEWARLVPSRRVDLVWQRHMLDTRAYAEDCQRLAGAFLHREHGASGEDYARTREELAPVDATMWDGAGLASVVRGGMEPAEAFAHGGGLEAEDLSGVVARARASLVAKGVASAWIEEGREQLATEAGAAEAVCEYRRFLALLMGCGERVTPCKLVDELWHQHILDSREYARFCVRVAGEFLHHTPHYEAPHGDHAPAFRRTKELYRERIGSEPPGRIWAHMGESGGGDGGGAPSSPYAIDRPDHVLARLRLGRWHAELQKRHLVLVRKGISESIWQSLLQDVSRVPQMTWEQIKTKGGTTWRKRISRIFVALGLAVVSMIGLKGCEWVQARHVVPELLIWPAFTALGAVYLIATIGFGVSILAIPFALANRPFDEDAIQALMKRYVPLFGGFGVVVSRNGNTIDVEGRFTKDEVQLFEEAERSAEREARQRVLDEAKRRKEQRAQLRAQARQERVRDRQARYVEAGIKPGPWAWWAYWKERLKSIVWDEVTFGWTRDLPEWFQPIVWGLGVSIAVLTGLALVLWMAGRME
jgi:hypothetical protein